MIQKHRMATLAILLTFVTAAAVGSWLIGSQIQSPAEAAARTAPPEPSPILVPVEERVLAAEVVARGTARYGLPKKVMLVPSTAKGRPAMITTLPERGTQLQEGDLLLTASERPVFLLQGAIPVYRDLTIGVAGSDVQQLEGALARLGFEPGAVDGVYDEATAQAVTAWYTTSGWQPAPMPSTQIAELDRLQHTLTAAREALAVAREMVALAPLQIEQARAKADYANKNAALMVAQREAALAELTARADGSDAAITLLNVELDAAQAAAAATKLEGQVTIQSAFNAQYRAERDAGAARTAVDNVMAALAVAEQRFSGYVPADEIVFAPSLPVRIENLELAVGDWAQGALLMVTNNQLAVDSQLPLAEALLVRPGMQVTIDEPDLGVKATGIIDQVADSPGTNGVDGYHVYFATTVEQSTTDINGFSVRLTIPVESTDGAVTVVPISALSLRADGRSVVEVARNGQLAMVVVEPGLAADGMVEVRAVEGELLPGQLVVVGYAMPEVQE